MVKKPFSVKVLGIPQLKIFLSKKNIKTPSLVNAGLEDAGDYVKEEVKSSINGNRAEPRSYITGDFYKSIEDKRGGNLSWTVFTDNSYAPWLEYGSAGNRKLRTGPRNHFRNTAKRSRTPVSKIIKKALRTL